MSNRTKKMLILSVSLFANIIAGQVSHAGWLEKSTGLRTPPSIRKIAPRGIQFPQVRSAPSRFGDPEYPRVTISNNTPYNLSYQVKTRAGWQKRTIGSGRQVYVDKGTAIAFNNAVGQWRNVTLRANTNRFVRQGRAIEMTWR